MKDEKVLCVSLSELKSHFDLNKMSWVCDVETLNSLSFSYIERQRAECDFSQKQIIPYVLVFNSKGELLHYRRCGSEKRLSGLYSAGIGGHLNENDEGGTMYERILSGLKREVLEEIGVSLSDNQIKIKGMINEDETNVGLCHIGIVFRIDVNESELVYEQELGSPEWKLQRDLDMSKFELWSKLAIGLIV